MRTPEFWSRSDALSRFVALALSPLGTLYGASVRRKARRAKPRHAKAKVVCIGNLTAGGVGKTPVAIAVAKAIRSRGLKPVFLTRGYGGRLQGPLLADPKTHAAADIGDEALLLARTAPVVVARDRWSGALAADAHGADVIVMDDGHQNFQLAKDVSLVVLDASDPFGNGRMLPAGPLREPIAQGLARADAIVTLGEGSPRLSFRGVVIRARLRPVSEQNLGGKRIVAFAGIGRPEKFFAMLKALGAELVDSLAYADHHAFSKSELTRLRLLAEKSKARLMTTEKDLVRMTPAQREGIDVLPVAVEFSDAAEINRIIETLCSGIVPR
jgi:tetraacyldisaccharide 4'-kinase